MSKRQGTLYEQKFVVKALERGLEPHPCPGEYLPHDYLVTNAAGRVFKTQIKGTSMTCSNRGVEKRRHVRYRITAGVGSHKAHLDCAKIDVLAVFIEPEDTWYVIPCLKITGKGLWFYASNENSKARYEKYKEDWDYFLTA